LTGVVYGVGMASPGTPPEPLILRFYMVNSGELVCRVTEPSTSRTWVVRKASDLRDLIYASAEAEHKA
jgi:hypothetical protein